MSCFVGKTGGPHPTFGPHDVMSPDCWCQPTYGRPCEDCDADRQFEDMANSGEVQDEPAGCWKCDKGVIPLTRAEYDAHEGATLVLHND